MRFIYIYLSILFLLPGFVNAQYSLSLDHVDGMSGNNILIPNTTITFHIRFTNPPSPNEANIRGSSNGFRVFSPDGAVWDPITWAPYFDFGNLQWVYPYENWYDIYNGALKWNDFSVTGEGADTIGFAGYSDPSSPPYSSGVPPGFSEIVYTITTQVDISQAGKTLCLDSSFYPPENYWLWGSDTGNPPASTGDIYPEWSGPHCYKIAYCCTGIRGNADGDFNEKINISDITYLVAYCFGGGPAPGCIGEANVNGDQQVIINISDITYLVAYCFGDGPSPPVCTYSNGTVVIDPSPDIINAPWLLSGPEGYSTSGTGDETITYLSQGYYTITWGNISGWVTPSNSAQFLVENGTIIFSGLYFEEGTGGTVTDIDGNVYQTITIGDQVWMAENLKVTCYSNGDPIPNITDNSTWSGLTSGAYCYYDNDEENFDIYGCLYNLYAVNDDRDIAPEGWHVPSDDEWKQLEISLGMSQSEADVIGWRGNDEGGKLKETGTVHWDSPNTGATNGSGFSAIPGGLLWFTFAYVGNYAYFWSITEYDDTNVWYRSLRWDGSDIYRNKHNKCYGFYIRCVKD